MEFREAKIPGVFIVDVARRSDDRGYFARTWCRRELESRGLDPTVVQINTGFSTRRGTLRGMHFQEGASAEIKFVRCTRGRVFDVALDLRPGSPAFRGWVGVELSAENGRMLLIPEGCAHGYQTLEAESELLYSTSKFYDPDRATGVRYDDPAFGIEWPLEVSSISDADRSWPDFPT
jgi:dTDP-4-dehydrorhamnose 3,5-epimerase